MALSSSVSKLPDDLDHVVILVNPQAGPAAAESLADALAWQLCRQDFTVKTFADLASATAQANQWYADGYLRAVVGVGGDGTAAALVNGTREGVPITVLPAGNSNLLARHFGLSKDPQEVCQTICDGATIQVDAGLANGRVFLLMAGCGFDAAVVERVHRRRTGHVSDRKYFQAVLASMWSYPFAEIQAHWQDQQGQPVEPPTLARWWFALNLPCYAAGLRIVPQADGFDGQLDVLGLRRGGSLCGLGYLVAILGHFHHRLPGCTLRRANRLRLTSGVTVPYQLDGDPGGQLPLDLSVLPARVTLVVPAATLR